jgi:internalin A
MSESDATPGPRRFRLRLSLRLTMAVVLIVAVVLGWVVTRARRQAETVEMVRRLGGQVAYDWEHRANWMGSRLKKPGPSWLTDRVGPDYNHDVTMLLLSLIPGGVDDSWAGRIAELRGLETLNIGASRSFTSVGLSQLSGLEKLGFLDVSGTGIKGGDFRFLKRMTRLTNLGAMAIPTGDDDLANLSGLTKLKWLSLHGNRLTDGGLTHLRPLTGVESLQIHGEVPMQVTSKGLAHLSGMSQLSSLVIDYSKIESLEPIRGLTALTMLGLNDARLDDQGLSPLANFARLRTLTLVGSSQRFGDAGMAYLAGLKSLNTLSLQDTQVGDAGLAHLAGLSKLESLFLGGTRVTDAGLAHLAGLSKLHMLSLGRTAITDAGLAHLVGLPAVRFIGLEGTKVTPAGIAALRSRNPKLQVH